MGGFSVGNIAAPCREQVLPAVASNEAPSDLALDNWQSSGQVCAAAPAVFQLLARYQSCLIPTSRYIEDILPPFEIN